MKKIMVLFMLVTMAGVLLWACSPSPSPATLPVSATTAAPKGEVEQNWEVTLAEAKKEGVVSVYALWRPETRDAVPKAFKAKYGISVEFSPFGRGAELMAKVQTEQRVGLYIADVFGAGTGTSLLTMKPGNVLGPVEPFLILPEVTNAKNWSGGRFPFLDKDKLVIGMIAATQRYIVYNTDLIKQGEITTYKDLLKDQYKGKITLSDPTMTGMGSSLLSHLALDVWNLEDTKYYLRQLIKQQQVSIQRDSRIHLESVAKGKYAIALAPMPDIVVEFLGVGAPIGVVIPKEGVQVLCMSGTIAVPPKLAHPNAARVFINWVLGKEGQTVFAKSFGSASLRLDVSTEGFNPIYLVQPGEKVFVETEDSVIFRGQILTVAKEVIDEASK